MISRRELIKVAPIVIGGALVLPSPALAHDSGGEAPLIPNPTNFETASDDFFLTGATVTCESWTTGSGLKEARILNGAGAVIGKGIEKDNHIDVWWEGEHYDFHDENLENRRLAIEDQYPVMSGGFVGIPDSAIQWGGVTRAIGAQYTRYYDVTVGRTWLIADMYTADLGWRRRVVDNNTALARNIASIIAGLNDITAEIREAWTYAIAQESVLAATLAVSGGSLAPFAGPAMLALGVTVGARLWRLYHKRMGQRNRLLGFFPPIETYNPFEEGDIPAVLFPGP